MTEEQLTKKEIKALRKEKIREILEKRKTAIKKTGIILTIILIGVFALQTIARELKNSNKDETAALANIITYKDWTSGAENPVVDLIIYTNFDCAECARAYEYVKQAETEFQSKIKTTFRHFFDAEKTPATRKLSELAESAGLQNKFWETHNLLFETQKEREGVEDLSALTTIYAQKLNLDIELLKNGMYTSQVTSKIKRDLENASVADVKNAPTIFVKDIKIESPKNYEELKSAIEKVLQEKVE